MAERNLSSLIMEGTPAAAQATQPAPALDLGRVKRNMQKMLDQGAQPQDIEQYAAHEGVTPEQMQAAAEPNWAMRQVGAVGDAVGSAYQGVKGAVQGQQDPAFAGTKGFTGEGLGMEDMSSIARAKLTSASVDDAAYGDVIKSTLGPRLKGTQKDKFGQELVTYTGDDGTERTNYVNEPGLEGQDVDRFISGAVPYAAAATGVGRLVKGAPLAVRAIGQALGAGATSVGTDMAAKTMGSEQPVSLERAGTAAAFGAGGEAAVAAGGALWRRFIKPDMFDQQTGALTAAGVKEAKKLGIDPSEVQGELARRFDEVTTAVDPEEAIGALKTNEFNIPTTRGQRSKNPEFLHQEEEMRRSLWGPGSRDIITDFDTVQKARIQEGADTVRTTVAPKGAATPQEAGQATGDALSAAKDTSRTAERQAWKDVPDIYPAEGAEAGLGPILQGKFKDLGFLPDEQLTPAAHKQMQLLTDYVGGKPTQQPYSLLGEAAGRPTIDEMRRRLLGMTQAAQSGQDKTAARAVYESFNDWVDDIGGKGQILDKPATDAAAQMQPEAAEKLLAAREFTKEQRRLFAQSGRNDDAGKLLENLSRNGDTPERIVRELFGATTTAAPKAGTVGALKRLKTIFEKNDPSAWDQVKAAYWLNVTRGKNGEVLTPGNLRSAIDKAFENQKSVVDAMFTPDEQAMIKRYRDAVDTATYVPPNPSGTSYGLASQKQRSGDNVLKFLLRRAGTRATFQGKTVKGGILHTLAKKAPDIGGTGEATRKAMAQNAINQTIKKKRVRSPLANALSVQGGLTEDED